MTKFPVLFAVVTLTFGVAQASTIYTNTFDLGQVIAGGPGPAAPAAATSFSGADTLDALGVTFDYTEGLSAEAATYGDSTLPEPSTGDFSYPLLDGGADGTLTLTFADPTDFVSFDIFYVFEPGDSGGSVAIGGTTPEVFTTNGDGAAFSAGSFMSDASAPFTTVAITFDEPSGVAFAIDNLSYDAIAPTPEPGSLALLVTGALLLGALVRLRRSPLRASNRM
jgi:hypothetical protein